MPGRLHTIMGQRYVKERVKLLANSDGISVYRMGTGRRAVGFNASSIAMLPLLRAPQLLQWRTSGSWVWYVLCFCASDGLLARLR